ncbi:uncharacterized protein BDZ99DRAFT_466646 [Mytilinidion resinicola]|uniref:Uncharacterized protein n=1 Tax=Mytilinidion resinicola TaxID=574789 RepID=A0A6A6YAH9_9PEZI|nr:uncharacterized protein BDZ99DRAFT_466646 [Mytilinidion resinicola]KAF2805710.1 hypothetical protein BDZ99DRAFT_466646 [Mytilinidion resinicola]
MKYPKTWFILPTTIYKPNDYIELGQVITDPRKPFERLAQPLPLEGVLAPRTSPSLEWSATNTKTSESSVGIFAHVVNIMTAEASGGKSQDETQTWKAALLETRFFEISEDPTYVDRTTKVKAVEEWLKKNRRLGKTVYMIVGLKIAKNPGMVTYDGSDSSNLNLNLKATLDPNGVVEGGGEIRRDTSNAVTYEERPEAAYVFAYRLRKLRVAWHNKFALGDNKAGGDLYGLPQGKIDSEGIGKGQDDDSAFEIESVLCEELDFGESLPVKDKKFEAVDEEDDSVCLVIKTRG